MTIAERYTSGAFIANRFTVRVVEPHPASNPSTLYSVEWIGQDQYRVSWHNAFGQLRDVSYESWDVQGIMRRGEWEIVEILLA